MSSFKSQLLQLTSKYLDVLSRSSRQAALASLIELLEEDAEYRQLLGSGGLALEASKRCSSVHAYRRLEKVVAAAIVASLGAEEDDGDDDSLALCHALCDIVSRSGNVSLLDDAASSFKSCEKPEALYEKLVAVAQQSKKDGASSSSDVIYPALSLASSLPPQDGSSPAQLMELFLSTFSTNAFPSSSQVTMAHTFLTTVSQSNFDEQLAPALGLKLRAHPDKVLPLLESICGSLGATAIDVSSQLTNDKGANLLPSVMKHLKSSKVEMRGYAWRTLILFAQLSGNENSMKPVELVTTAICAAFGAGGGLTTGDLRAGAYAALEGIARHILNNNDNNNDEQSAALGKLTDKALTALTGGLPKDKSSAASADPTLVAKDCGTNALLAWMQLAKRAQATKAKSGYDKALDHLADPCVKYSAKDGEFRFRIGSLIVPPSSAYLASVNNDNIGGESFMESVIVDLMDKKNIQKGLETIVDLGIKKHSTSGAIAQIDGALSIFLLVLYKSSRPTSSKFALSASASKVLVAGGTAKGHETSFLYSPSFLDSARTDALSSYILHRTIAMHVKTTSKLEEGGAKRVKGDQPLVRIIEKRLEEGHEAPYSAATKAMAVCAANPHPLCKPPSAAYSSIHASLKTMVTYSPVTAKAADALLYAVFVHVNERSLKDEETKASINESRSSREQFEPVDETFNKLPSTNSRGKLSATAGHRGYAPATVRAIANELMSHVTIGPSMWRALVLSHAGTTMRANRRQQVALVGNMLERLTETVLPLVEKNNKDEAVDEFAKFIALCSASSTLGYVPKKEGENDAEGPPQDKATANGGTTISPTVHTAALSLINTLGGIAGSFDVEFDDPEEDEEKRPYAFAYTLCVQKLPAHLVEHLNDFLGKVEGMTEDDAMLFMSPKGVLFKPPGSEAGNGANPSSAGSAKPVAKAKKGKNRGAKGGFNAFEDEEWERQVKKDLAKKKKALEKVNATATDEKPLTLDELKLLASQTEQREGLSRVLRGDFPRALATIRCLCDSDIEVGNATLTMFGQPVIRASISTCAVLTSIETLGKASFDTLTTLAGCVYEVEEVHAATIARALIVSFGGSTKEELKVSPLPSPCASAACSIFEMNEYGDCLSGNSFSFLFPILKAALSGPRNIPGCDMALTVLDQHFVMLVGDDEDPKVKGLRKEMALTVLELLSHDRCQTFVNPTAYEALIGCYTTDEEASGTALTAPEIAPLLGEKGALGGENARVASMETLASIAERHPKLVKNNPLVENRIWLNCFDKKDRIKLAARKAWLVARGNDMDVDVKGATLDPPSKMYAVPLLPLLSHEDASIALAAATSLSCAMGMHPTTAEKNIVKLCNTFIGSFPAPGSDGSEDQPKSGAAPAMAASPFPVAPPPAAKKVTKKKIIDTGLTKKKKKTSAVSGSMARITGGPPPRKTAASRKMLAKVAAPKAERQLDQSSLMDQFKAPSSTETKKKKVAAEEDSEQKVSVRMGVLRAISAFTDASSGGNKVQLELPLLKILLGFLMAFGLGDGNEGVRSVSRNAARDIVAQYCATDEAIAFFLPQLESVLNTGQADYSLDPLSTEKVPKTISASDYRKEGVVVSLGSMALHLKNDGDEDKIDGIIDMLLAALKTPSEDVQSSVALCLSKLMKKGRTQSRIETLLNDLMTECIHGSSLAGSRGAAYGISAAVKGSGIASLKKYEVVKRLEEACTSGSPSSKEGSLFCIELLSARLGILFEPYVIVLLPALLKAFSDSNDYVRSAADKTVGLIMGKLSGHGVKLVMPAVLDAFNEPEWRTKQASIHMLGSMSHCAPKQLASCLPKVVPKLTEAFSDTHPKVKSSAEEALEEICKVIKNPEISSISATLLRALTDASATLHALEALISTEFVHAIDAPSLSIIIPVVHRGLRDRAATTKRYAALISGNICTMVNDARDFVPYLPILLPDLKSTLLDPIPDVRSISAKSLGSLTRGLGEATFPDLRPWLIDTMRSETGSTVERSGAAQGLSELLVSGGAQLTENVMINEILPLSSHPKAGTREGVLWVLTFLPSVLGQAYSSLIDESLPALLSGLADDNEGVRDVALRAGRVLVKSHGKAHKDKILPSLEEGLSNEDYRIRCASLTLLGDLLGMLGGTKVGKANTDTQDDIRQAERAQAQIALALGNVTRKRVLSSLYLARSDTAAVVRQSAVQVWKTVVSVTVRTLREILSQLVDQIVTALASGDPERTQVAGRCLGDIVHKLGDQVLPEIIPVLRDNLYKGDEYTRQGVCVGLAEVIDCSSKEQIIKFLEILVKAVQDALCDDDEEVRTMATTCFQNLYNVVGNRTLDEIVPALLVGMESDDDSTKTRALNGMTGILSVRSRELLPYIIPKLIKTPLTISHADALGTISDATSATIHMHFSSIIPTLIMELASFSEMDLDEEEKEREEAVRQCFRAVCHNVDTTGVNWLISEIASKCMHDKASVRKEACWSYQAVVEERKKAADFYEQVPVILRELLHRLNDDSTVVLKANNKALGALTSCVPAEELVTHLQFIRNLIASMVSDARYRKGGVGKGDFFLPGFNMPKGLEPLLPVYQRGILYGDATVRETAAAGLGELITITANKFLAGPFLIKLTGPLLRIVGDRNPSAVKIAIVQTLGLILTKGGPVLRAFVPQFQTTFVKALSDPSRQVRIEAIKALALLMPLSTRVDPLIKELVATSLGNGSNATVETAGMVAIQTATLEALAIVLKHGGSKVKVAESIPSSLDAGKELLAHEDDGIRESAAKVIGYACELLGTDEANTVLQECVLDISSNSCSPETNHGIACICRRILSRSIGPDIDRGIYSSVSKLIQTLMKDDKTIVKEAACVAIGAVLGSSTDVNSTLSSVEKNIAKCMDTKEELVVQQAVANGLCISARMQPGVFRTQEGLALINNALKLAMSGAQRVQFSYNDFLWIALDVQNGEDGLEEYLALAHFDSAKKMQSIYSKVLVKIKAVNDDEL